MTCARRSGAGRTVLLALAVIAGCTSDAAGGPRSETTSLPTASATTSRTATPGSGQPVVSDTPTLIDETVTIAAVGDLMLARDVAAQMATEGALYPFERVIPMFRGADLLIGNLEGAFTNRGEPLEKTYTFRSPPALAEGLALAVSTRSRWPITTASTLARLDSATRSRRSNPSV